MVAELGKVPDGLLGALYADVKHWVVGLGASTKRAWDKSQAADFEGPAEFLAAAREGRLRSGQEVILKCRPSPFGPFLRRHFLNLVIGPRSDMRRGPSIDAPNPIFGMFAHMTSHLTPVGLFPPMSGKVRQVQLYPSGVPACGTVSQINPFSVSVPSLPGVVSDELEPFLGKPMRVRGRARFLDARTLNEAGFLVEDHEILRQEGRLWFFDATDDLAEAEAAQEDVDELWGGLYAEGHVETKGGAPLKRPVLESVAEAMDRHGVEPLTSASSGKMGGITCYGVGVRAHFHKKIPLYSLHMDVELLSEFQEARKMFDDVTAAIHAGFEESCRQGGGELMNPRDLDFSYVDSTAAYTVLRSMAAEQLVDPVAVAIRDWHRLRGSGGGRD